MSYDFEQGEKSVLKFWQNEKIYEKLVERNKDGKKYYWLQGPPYTSGALHSGQAWNHSLKDMNLRYRRMKSQDVWDRNGYDMHGLPTAHKVMGKHNLKTKEDIENFSVEKFIKECDAFAREKAEIMTQDLKRFGVWLNYEDPYMPVNNDFIESEWWLIKQAHNKNRLYRGQKPLTWCFDCETACAKHELEYKNVTDKSVYVKLKIIGKENEYLIIWTTTPWTLPLNQAVMVNPELDYVKADVNGEVWIIAKGLANALVANIANIELKIVEEFKGDKLEGIRYEPIFEEELKELYDDLRIKSDKVFSVLLSKEYVDLSAGSGLVHCAGGCGPEDAEVCRSNGIPPLNPVKENGYYPENLGALSGWHTKKDTRKFIDILEKKKVLLECTPVDHDYAHCDRCHNPIIYRTTEQWFFKIEDLKEKMVSLNADVHWVPQAAKNNFDSWLRNLRDNSITKQRFWGTPVPIWINENDENDYIVIESREELASLVGEEKIPENLHRPWIDEVVIEKEGKRYKRIPDILDVWVDAGIGTWNCLYYPKRKDLFEKYFPIDFIVEGKDQIRGWFNILLVASMLTVEKMPFRNVHMHGFVTDVDGVKMSKSLGNIISPYEIVEKHGADTMRYYFSGNKAGEDMNFSWDEIKLKHKNLLVLWNTHKFLIDLAKTNNLNPRKLGTVEEENFGLEEKYIISKLNSTIKAVTEKYENYNLDEVASLIEELFLELSRTYIQLVRDKAATGSEEEKSVVCYCIYKVLLETIKMLSTVCPFITETMYQNLKEEFSLTEESVHYFTWPEYENGAIDEDLEAQIQVSQQIITAGLAAREKAKIGRRWPVKEMVVVTRTNKEAVAKLKELIMNQLNSKDIVAVPSAEFVTEKISPNPSKLGPKYGGLAGKIIQKVNSMDNNEILDCLNKENLCKVEVEGNNFELTKEDFKIEREIEGDYVEAESRVGFVYLCTEQSSDLLAEGYAREIVRQIQDARKNHGLQKSDEIQLYLKVPDHLLAQLKDLIEEIKLKTGSKEMELSDQDSNTQYEHSSEFTVKKFEFKCQFNKL